MAVPRRRPGRRRVRLGRGAADRREGLRRRPGGIPRRLADLAGSRRLGRSPVRPLRGGSDLEPDRRVLRGDVRVHDDRRHGPHRHRGNARLAADLAAADAVARRHGDHRARPRRAPASAGRRTATPRARAPGARVRADDGPDPRYRAAALGPVCRADGRDGADPQRVRLDGDRRRDEPLPGPRPCLLDAPDRRLLHRGPWSRDLRPGVPMGHRRVHGDRRRELRAALPPVRPGGSEAARARRGVPSLRRRCFCSAPSSSPSSSGPRESPRARRRSEPRSSSSSR